MKRIIGCAMVLLACVASAAKVEKIKIHSAAKGGVFTVKETPTVSLSEPVKGLVWMLFDWQRNTLASGLWPADGRLTFPGLPQGYYFVQARNADVALREFTFCIVPDPATRAYPRDSFYGVDAALSWVCSPQHYAVNWYGDNSYRACLDLIKLSGLPHLRERMCWGQVSSKPGEYQWGHYLDNAKMARARGLLVSGMFHDAAKYAKRMIKGPSDMGAVYRFCRDMGAAFGDAMGDWEFWNEQDIGFWPDPVWDYMSAMKAAYLGFRAANPSMPVLNGAVCTGQFGTFDELMFENDLAKYSNVFNFHIYLPPSSYPSYFAKLYSFLDRVGAPNRQVWITESSTNIEGESDGEGLFPGYRAHSYEQEMVLAELYAKNRIYMQMGGIARDYFFVFGAYNERNGTKDWGVQRRDGSVKPIFSAISATTEHLVGATIEGEKKVGDGIRCFVFRQKDGSQSLAYWSVSPCDTAQGDGARVAKQQRMAIDRPFSLAVADGAYPSANWCGTKGTATAKDGKLALVASRYASFVDGLKGIAVDRPAKPIGEIENYAPAADEDLSVVMRIEFPTNQFRVAAQKTIAETDDDHGAVKLHVWNFSETPKTGRICVEDARLEGLPETVTLPAMGCATLDATLRFTNTAKSIARVCISGVFNGRRTSRLVAPIRSDKLLLATSDVVALPANDVAYWERNDSAATTKISWDEQEKAVRFDCAWNDPKVDRWFYPLHRFKDRAESFDGASLLEFEVKMQTNKMENNVSTSLVMLFPPKDGGRSHNMGYTAPIDHWEKRRVALTGSHGEPLANGMGGFRVGCNPYGTQMTYWIRNVRLIKPR